MSYLSRLSKKYLEHHQPFLPAEGWRRAYARPVFYFVNSFIVQIRRKENFLFKNVNQNRKWVPPIFSEFGSMLEVLGFYFSNQAAPCKGLHGEPSRSWMTVRRRRGLFKIQKYRNRKTSYMRTSEEKISGTHFLFLFNSLKKNVCLPAIYII